MQSILTSVKKLLGITEEYEHFDGDIILHINSVFSILQQLGVGDPNGFMIFDKTSKWTDFLVSEDPRLNMVKTYMFLKVKQMFDPSQSGIVTGAYDKQISELEWRLNVQVDPPNADNTGYDEVTATDEEIQDLIEDLDSLGKEYYPDPTADQEEIDYIIENLDDMEPDETASGAEVEEMINELDKIDPDDPDESLDGMTAGEEDIQEVIDSLDDLHDDPTATNQEVQETIDNLDSLGDGTSVEQPVQDPDEFDDEEDATQEDIDNIIDGLDSL